MYDKRIRVRNINRKIDESVTRFLPTAREGNVFTGVCLSTIGLMDTGSLLGLVAARSYWNAFLLELIFNQNYIMYQNKKAFQ